MRDMPQNALYATVSVEGAPQDIDDLRGSFDLLVSFHGVLGGVTQQTLFRFPLRNGTYKLRTRDPGPIAFFTVNPLMPFPYPYENIPHVNMLLSADKDFVLE
jgi:hypothetical protein